MTALWKRIRLLDKNIREDKKFAFAFTVLAGFILAGVLFIGKRPGVVDWGNYNTNLRAMDLVYTEEELEEPEDLYYTEVIEEFEFETLDLNKIVQTTPGVSLIYPVAVVWVVCTVLGISFSTMYLSIIYSVITMISFYYIMRALYRLIGYRAAFIGILIPFLFFGSEFLSWFNSLELEACTFVGLFMFSAAILTSIAAEKETGRSVYSVLFTGWFLLNSKAPYTIFMYVPILIIIIALAYYHRPDKEKQFLYGAKLFGILLYMAISVIGLSNSATTISEQANRYDAIYNGLLTVSENPKADIETLGLPKESIEDVGLSFYLDEEEYAYFPRSEVAKEEMFAKITFSTLVGYYCRHPHQLWLMIEEAVSKSAVYSDNRFMYVGERADEPHSTVSKLGWWNDLRKAVSAKNTSIYFLFYGMAMIGSVFVFFRKKNSSKAKISALLYFCFIMISFTQLIAPFIIKGWGYIEKELFCYMMITDLLLIFGGLYFFYKIYLLYVDIQEGSYAVRQEMRVYDYSVRKQNGRIKSIIERTIIKTKYFFNNRVFAFKWRAALFFTVLAALIIWYVMFSDPRIGCRNNGDYGRVMDSIGISFKTVADDELSVTRITEEFYWADFNWSDFMNLNPKLSNVYVASLLRVFCEPRGIPYNSFYAAIIYAIILIISYWIIFYSLYGLFDKNIYMVMSTTILIVFLGKMHLGWINSLFGEGVIYVGMVAMISWILSIIASPQGKGMWKFIPFFIAARVLCGAKGQTTISFPIVLGLALILFIYHVRKAKWMVKILATVAVIALSGFLSIECVRLYQQNDTNNAAMNVWQSMFTGLLVIVDDPVQTLLDFEMDPNMVVDIGKHAYYKDEEYYIGPLTKEAETALWAKVDTMKLLKYYIMHPKYLYRTLEHAAGSASLRMPDWLIFLGQIDNEENEEVSRFSFWEEFRISFAPDHFMTYVAIYLIIITYVFRSLWKQRKKTDKRMQLLKVLYLAVTAIGILQYPLSVIGNGFTDNTKQMYLFILCFDFSIVFMALEVYRRIMEYDKKRKEDLVYNGIEKELV